jgi:uncharacterized protein (UPF0276 family)
MSPLIQGAGLGLRREHYREFVEQPPREVAWLEVISENYLVAGGKPLHFLDRIRRDYPMVMHGVSLSIGSTDPLRRDYLRDIAALARRIEPAWISDHLCWTSVGGRQSHDLLPLALTENSIRHVARRVSEVQDMLGRRLVLENVSSYLRHACDEMDEAEFLKAVLRESDCLLLLDVNNVYVSSRNHRFDPFAYLDGLPAERIVQIHLAGHQDLGDIVIDTHDHPIRDEVWALYAHAIDRFGAIPTMIERDDDIPPLATLLEELTRVRELLGARRAQPLGELQSGLFAAITTNDCPKGLIADAAASGARGLAVYRRAYLARLREALADNYSGCARALGDARFSRLADAYAAACPPTEPSLRHYGDRLGDFIDTTLADQRRTEDATAEYPTDGILVPHPAFGDLARLDWALRATFDAADARPLAATALSALAAEAWPGLRFALLPSARLLTLDWSVEAAWHLLNEAALGDEPVLPEPTAHVHHLLIWRPALETRWRSIEADECRLIEALQAGASFAELCAAQAEGSPDEGAAALGVVACLQQWLADELLADFSGS